MRSLRMIVASVAVFVPCAASPAQLSPTTGSIHFSLDEDFGFDGIGNPSNVATWNLPQAPNALFTPKGHAMPSGTSAWAGFQWGTDLAGSTAYAIYPKNPGAYLFQWANPGLNNGAIATMTHMFDVNFQNGPLTVPALTGTLEYDADVTVIAPNAEYPDTFASLFSNLSFFINGTQVDVNGAAPGMDAEVFFYTDVPGQHLFNVSTPVHVPAIPAGATLQITGSLVLEGSGVVLFTPTPGALAVFALAGMRRSRRRRA